MRKNSGQALVEFIIILPILLLILMGMVDFGNIIYQKYHLESNLDTVVSLYQNGRSEELTEYLKEEKITAHYIEEDVFIKVKLQKDVKIITPGLNTILKSPYEVSVERTVYNE